MVETSKIEWTDHTFNPWIGCQEVSPACDHCYARTQNNHRKWVNGWGPHGQRRRTSEAYWHQPLKWNRDAERAGTRAKVFCASLADVFDKQVPAEWRADLWGLIEQTPQLDWLILTKRPPNALGMITEAGRKSLGVDVSEKFLTWPWHNVWLGTTVENQEEADRRIPQLLNVPAAKRFLSCEPLLGPVNLERIQAQRFVPEDYELDWKFNALTAGNYYEAEDSLKAWFSADGPDRDDRIDWVIVGGESGPTARPMHPDWARSIRDQCQDYDVPFFFKQWGEWQPGDGDTGHGQQMYRVGKKAAGAMLDGREWRETPA